MWNKDKHILHRIYENIDLVIKNKGINKGEVEEAIGVNRGYLSRRCNMSAVTLYKLSNVLDVKMDSLCSDRLTAKMVEAQIKDLQEVLRELKCDEGSEEQ
jgi:transcriptional regulator with XRE-family HTH domain